MKRTLILIASLLALFGAGFWLFGNKPKPSTSATTQDEKTTQKTKTPRSHTPLRSTPQEASAAEFEDDPNGALKLEGQVVDEKGQAVEGAEVAVNANPPKRATSDAHGWFSFEGLVARNYNVEARKEGAFGSTTTPLSSATTPITVQLVAGGTLKLIVLDENDRHPIAAAHVSIGELTKTEATTNEKGEATLHGLYGWEALSVEADGYGPFQDFLNASKDASATLEKTITMAPGAMVSGIVLDPTGAPAVGAHVTVETDASFRFFRGNDDDEKITTNEEGRWEIKALSAGTYRFRARHGKFAPGLSAPITLDGKTKKDDVEIRLEEGAAVSGKVVSPSGAPVPGAMVSIARDSKDIFSWEPKRSAYSDDNGEFLLEGLAKGPLRAVAKADEVYSEIVSVDASDGDVKDVTLALAEDKMITGVVVTDKGQPVADAEVSGFPKERSVDRATWRLRGMPRSISDADGNFELHGIPEGKEFMLSASTASMESGGGMPWGGEDAVTAKAGDVGVKIILKSYGTIKGKVLFADGTVPEKYEINLGWNETIPFSNPDGSFEIKKADPGKTRLTVGGPNILKTAALAIEVKAGEPLDVGTLTVEAGRAFRGKVLSDDGSPVVGATVMAGERLMGEGAKMNEKGFGPVGGAKSDVSKEDGSFEIGGLSSKALYAVADHPSLGRSAVIKLPEGKDALSLDLTLLPVSALEGAVTFNGKPTKALLTLLPVDARGGSSFHVRSGDDGLYRFDRLAAGNYLLTAARTAGGMGPFAMGGSHTANVTIDGKTVATCNIDIPGGVTVEIHPTFNGEAVKNISATLLRGSYQAADSKALEAISNTLSPDTMYSGVMMDVPMMASDKIKIEDVAPGQYTLCTARLPSFAEIQAGTVDLEAARPLLCAAVTVAATPEKQDFNVEVPAP